MRFLDRQSIIILLIGPIFLVIYFVINIDSSTYRSQFDVAYDNHDTLFLDQYLVSNKASAINIGPWVKYFYDQSLSLTFQDVVDKTFTPEFMDSGPGVWKKILLHSDNMSTTWYLGTQVKKTEYYYRVNDGSLIRGEVGTDILNTTDLFKTVSVPFVPIHIPQNSTVVLYLLSSEQNPSTQFNNHLWRLHGVLSNRSFIYEFHNELMWNVIPELFILLTVFLYHFVLFLFNRDRTFLLLSLTALSLCMILCRDNDLLIRYFDFRVVGQFTAYFAFISTIFYVIFIPFAITYLQIKKDSTWWYILIGYAILYVAYWLFQSLQYHLRFDLVANPTSRQLTFIVLLLGNFVMFLVTIVELLNKNKRAITFFAGYGTVFIGFVATLLFAMGFYNFNHFNLSYAVGFLLFSVGLAKDYRAIQEEKFKTEQERATLQHQHQIESQERKRLKDLNKYKSKLYTNITHEFRTPLTIISGVAENIKGHQTEKTLIKRNTKNLLGLVNAMLDLNKIDAGHLKPQWTQINIIPLTKYIAESHLYACKSKSIDLKIESLRESLWMDTDPYFLESIISNLLQNAIKYTPNNGQISIRILKDDESNTCQIKVADTGKGIPEDKLDKIFDRFYQTGNQKSNIEGGTGIGLAIVKELTNLLHGNVSVSSIIHEGSTFTISLPITQNASIQSWSPQEIEIINSNLENQGTERKKGASQILLVEDSADIRKYLEMLLHKDFTIITSGNGKEGFNKAIREIPDIIISDIMMPEMDGIEFCHLIKNDRRTSHIPIIILTAKSTQEDRLAGLYEGADAYLTKPFDKRELLIRINTLLENRQKIRAYFQQFGTLPPEESLENQFVRKVMEHIDSQVNSELYQIEDLADYMHLSRTQLYRKLKALTGKTFTEIIKECRVGKAKTLLVSSDKTVSEIAFQVGFSDPAYFSRVFKTVEKCTPLQYRKQTGWPSQTS